MLVGFDSIPCTRTEDDTKVNFEYIYIHIPYYIIALEQSHVFSLLLFA